MVDLLTREQLETLGEIGQIVVGHLIEESELPTPETPGEPGDVMAGPGTPRQ